MAQANVNLVVSNEQDQANAVFTGPKIKYRIQFATPFWLIEVRNPDSDTWQQVRKTQPVVAYTTTGLPISVFPLEHFDTYTEAHDHCVRAFQGIGVEEYIKPKKSFWQRHGIGTYEE